jgi:hypothetical protein
MWRLSADSMTGVSRPAEVVRRDRNATTTAEAHMVAVDGVADFCRAERVARHLQQRKPVL